MNSILRNISSPQEDVLHNTSLGIIETGLLTTEKKWRLEKCGETSQVPPHYIGRKFTSDQPLILF